SLPGSSPLSLHVALPIFADGVVRLTGGSSLAPRTDMAGLDRASNQQSYLTALGLLHRMKDRPALDEAVRLLEALLRNTRDSAARSEEHTSELQSRSDLVC